MDRAGLMRAVKRVVVKVGTSVLTDASGAVDRGFIGNSLGEEVCGLRRKGYEVILVSSGAIGSGMGLLGMKKRPKTLAALQASAAVGQGVLIGLYEEVFRRHGCHAAQILLTRDDLADRRRYLNARATLREVLRLGAIPVINENDTVAVEEIKFGDNDLLSALVTNVVHADLLILLSDVEGLYRDPAKRDVIPLVERYSKGVLEFVEEGRKSRLGVGGMEGKLKAVEMTVAAGEPVVIAGGRVPRVISRILAGENLGTLFLPAPRTMKSRERWLRFAPKARGRVFVDAGARRALLEGGRSLLPIGVRAVEGNFRRGDIVEVALEGGEVFARGLCNYSAEELLQARGVKTSDLAARLGYTPPDEAIHRDNLLKLET
ncbi:MAG: glutamate 5-kinase [Planctomycetota bacterium]